MRFQLLWPESKAVPPDIFNQMMTMHGTTMIFFVGHADPGRRGQLHRAAADRGTGHGLSPAQCLGPVGDAVRRHRWPISASPPAERPPSAGLLTPR